MCCRRRGERWLQVPDRPSRGGQAICPRRRQQAGQILTDPIIWTTGTPSATCDSPPGNTLSGRVERSIEGGKERGLTQPLRHMRRPSWQHVLLNSTLSLHPSSIYLSLARSLYLFLSLSLSLSLSLAIYLYLSISICFSLSLSLPPPLPSPKKHGEAQTREGAAARA